MRWWGLLAAGCTAEGGDPLTAPPEETGADTEELEPEAPCPFAGSWVVSEALCGEYAVLFESPPQVTVTGSAALCDMQIEAVAAVDEYRGIERCAFTEHLALHARSFGFWDAYTDATGAPACRDALDDSRSLGQIEVVQQASSLSFTLEPEFDQHFLQLTFCHNVQHVTMSRP